MIRMKQVATKITEYVKKSKRAKLYGVFGLIYLIAVIFVMNDAWLYQTPIAKLTKVETSIAGENKSTRGTQEIKYKQKNDTLLVRSSITGSCQSGHRSRPGSGRRKHRRPGLPKARTCPVQTMEGEMLPWCGYTDGSIHLQ